jgi:hypothetical protein
MRRPSPPDGKSSDARGAGSLTVMIKPEDSGEKNDDEEAQNADCEAYAVAERIHQMLTTTLP